VPELLEIEAYRRVAEGALHRTIAAVDAPDPWYLKGGLEAGVLRATLLGRRLVGARRTGKVLLLDTDGDGVVLGLRFGMTGRLLVDGAAGVEHLEYSSNRYDPGWVRFALGFDDGGRLEVVDPRRLGGVELDPDEDHLGVDAGLVTPAQLVGLLDGSVVAVKARIMDQRRLAGVGNLLADDALWRAKLDPARASRSLSRAEVRRLHRALQATLLELGERGGSHTGALQPERHRDGRCPRCGTPLERRTIGGRTTYSCPRDQR
jgi:formamidopyrimidine-DNA glycosylase